MNTAHLTEAQLQLYADDAEAIGSHLKEHLAHCSNCQIKLENYRLINGTLKAMPAPAFDFDLAEQVLASVTVKKAPVAWVPLLAAAVGVLLVALIMGMYARNIAVWFVALPKAWSYMLTIPVLVFLLVQLTLSVFEYQRKMNMLLSK